MLYALLVFCTRPPTFICDTGIHVYQIPGPIAETNVTYVLPPTESYSRQKSPISLCFMRRPVEAVLG